MYTVKPASWSVFIEVVGTISIASIWWVFSAVTIASSFVKYWSPKPSMWGAGP